MATLSQMKKGLSLRPTYDQVLLSYLSGGPDIKKPDRTARFIRESPQYQDLLKTDFIDLQKQQNNILKAQKKDVLLKEMVASSESDMKSVKSSVNGNGESAAYKSLELDLSAISELSAREDDSLEEMYERLDDYDEQQQRKKERGQQLVQQHLDDVHKDAERAIGRKEAFLAAKVTGYEPVPPTGDKEKDKHIAEGQRLGTLRVLPAGSGNPPYISELSKNPEKLERQREYLGLSQAASSSSSGQVQHNISTPRAKPKAKSGDTGGSSGSNEPKKYVAAIGESPENVTYNKDGSPRKQRSDVGKTRTKK